MAACRPPIPPLGCLFSFFLLSRNAQRVDFLLILWVYLKHTTVHAGAQQARIAVEEKGRNTSIADSPGIRSLSSLLERSASTSQNNPSVHVAISRVPNRREREYPRVGRGGPSLLDDDSSTSLHKIRPPRMCIEVVIERGVLETEGAGGYFVCLAREPNGTFQRHLCALFSFFAIGGDSIHSSA